MDKIRSIINSMTLDDDGDKEEERARDRPDSVARRPIRRGQEASGRPVQRRPQEEPARVVSRSAALIVDGGGGVQMIRQERIEAVIIRGDPGSNTTASSSLATGRSRPAISCNTACTFDKYGSDFRTQSWFECLTCWGAESSFGCCEYCAKKCHVGHRLVSHQPSGFFCDCGKNCHKNAVCTYHSTGKEFMRQPFYRCYSCFSGPSEGCCFQCVKRCHAGHNVAYAGVIRAYCDCGLTCCLSSCKIAGP